MWDNVGAYEALLHLVLAPDIYYEHMDLIYETIAHGVTYITHCIQIVKIIYITCKCFFVGDIYDPNVSFKVFCHISDSLYPMDTFEVNTLRISWCVPRTCTKSENGRNSIRVCSHVVVWYYPTAWYICCILPLFRWAVYLSKRVQRKIGAIN